MNVETRHVRYIFADVVRFTEDRTLEAQVEIVAALNNAFSSAIGDLETIYLPTGDGICAGILHADVPADIHLQTALKILELFYEWSSNSGSNRQAEIRIAINESVDAIVTDINGNRNLAGLGINSAQRLMSIADGNQIIVGRAAYETLHIRDKYADAFRELKAEVKHGHVVGAYQCTIPSLPYLDIRTPWIVAATDPIDLEMTEDLEKPSGYSTPGMVDAHYRAQLKWEEEVQTYNHRIAEACDPEELVSFEAARDAWQMFFKTECEYLAAMHSPLRGTIFRVICAGIRMKLVHSRPIGKRKKEEG